MPRVKGSTTRRDSDATRGRLIAATSRLLADVGYAGTTTRAIGEAADCNAALVSYHFGSLNTLLLAALDASSEQRMARYREQLARARNLKELRGLVRRLYREDRDTGHVTILAELVAGGLTDPDLGAQVATRVHPWVQLAEDAIRQVVPTAALRRRMPVKELAYAIVALFLGLELLGQLTGDHRRGDAVVQRLTSGRSLPRIDTEHLHSDRP